MSILVCIPKFACDCSLNSIRSDIKMLRALHLSSRSVSSSGLHVSCRAEVPSMAAAASVLFTRACSAAGHVPTPASSATVVPASGYTAAVEKPVDVTFGEISTAVYRIRSGVERTLMHRSRKISNLLVGETQFPFAFSTNTKYLIDSRTSLNTRLS
jgi:hypothetical protein